MADIQVSLELDDTKYNPKLDAVSKKTKEFSDNTEKGFKLNKESFAKLGEAAETVKGKMESLGAAIVGVGLTEYLAHVMEGAETTVNLAKSLGITTAAMMDMNQAAAGVGKSAGDVGAMMNKLEIFANNYVEGTGKARDAAAELGVTFNDLKTKSPDQVFAQVVHAIAGIEDPSKRAALAMEAFGKGARGTNWEELDQKLQKATGTHTEMAAAAEHAAAIMGNLKEKAGEVANQFLLLAEPVLKWIQPFTEGTEGAARQAMVLVGVMSLFAAGAAIVGINSVVNAVRNMAAAFGLTAGAGRAEAIALQENSAVTMQSTAAKLRLAEAGYAAKVASLEESIALMKENGELQSASIATRQLATAKANLAMASGQAALAIKIGASAEVSDSIAANGASVATSRLAGAMGTLRTATVTFLGPIGAAIAAIGSLAAVGQAIWGKNGIAHGGNGANFISDMLGITDSSGDEAKADMQKEMDKATKAGEEEMKKLKDTMKTPSMVSPEETKKNSDTEQNNQKIASLIAQNAAQKQNNLLAQEKINLEVAMVGASDDERAAAMANFEAYAQGQKEILKLDNEIAQAKAQKADKNKEGPARVIAELESQKKLVQEQTQEQMKLNEENAKTLSLAQNTAKLKAAELGLSLKVQKDIADMQSADAEGNLTKEEKARQAVLKNASAEEESINKLKQAQLGSEALSQAEKTKTHELVMGYYNQELDQQQKLAAESRTFTSGWNDSWKQWADGATNASLVGKQMFGSMMSNLDQGFKDLMNGNQVNWKSMVNNMVQEMMLADFHSSIAKAFGGGNTSGGSVWGGLFSGGHADGGSIPAGGFGVVGENGPEYVHGPATVTPTTGINAANGGGTSVNYTIHANDAKSFQQMLAQDPTFLYALTLKGQRGMPGGV